jgi:hypothetical protein
LWIPTLKNDSWLVDVYNKPSTSAHGSDEMSTDGRLTNCSLLTDISPPSLGFQALRVITTHSPEIQPGFSDASILFVPDAAAEVQ